MRAFSNGQWTYKAFIPEGVTLNGTEYLITSDDYDVALTLDEADARLIAAAPDMYELLQQVAFGSCEDCVPLMVAARNIIARIDSDYPQ